MPRQARRESGTAVYHVMARGNNKRAIFSNNKEKSKCLGTIQNAVKENNIILYAWCIMDNHLHMVVKSELDDLARCMKSFGIKYANFYNAANQRVGHVFQDRFRSEVILGDEQLLTVVRYIHHNPVKAGMVKEPCDYSWSSYSSFLSATGSELSYGCEAILEYFNHNVESFKSYHAQFADKEFEDTKEIDDIQETYEKLQMEKALNMIEAYYYEHHVSTPDQALISKLVRCSQLSHRKLAMILNVSPSRIDRVSRSVRGELAFDGK